MPTFVLGAAVWIGDLVEIVKPGTFGVPANGKGLPLGTVPVGVPPAPKTWPPASADTKPGAGLTSTIVAVFCFLVSESGYRVRTLAVGRTPKETRFVFESLYSHPRLTPRHPVC